MSIYHADHGVDLALVAKGIEARKCQGFFLFTMELPDGAESLRNNLYGPVAGDLPVRGVVSVRDSADAWRGDTPFIDLPPRETRLMTCIGIAASDSEVQLFTAYGGPAAERLPSDPNISSEEERERCAAFWAEHALSIAAKKLGKRGALRLPFFVLV